MGTTPERPHLGVDPPPWAPFDLDLDDVALIVARVWPEPADAETVAFRTALAGAALQAAGAVLAAIERLRQACADNDETRPWAFSRSADDEVVTSDGAALADVATMDRAALEAEVVRLRARRLRDERAIFKGLRRAPDLATLSPEDRETIVEQALTARRRFMANLMYDRAQLESSVVELRARVAGATATLRELGSIIAAALDRRLLPPPRDPARGGDAEADS